MEPIFIALILFIIILVINLVLLICKIISDKQKSNIDYVIKQLNKRTTDKQHNKNLKNLINIMEGDIENGKRN